MSFVGLLFINANAEALSTLLELTTPPLFRMLLSVVNFLDQEGSEVDHESFLELIDVTMHLLLVS